MNDIPPHGVVFAALSLLGVAIAIPQAFRAAAKAQAEAVRAALLAQQAMDLVAKLSKPAASACELSREERISRARGYLAAAAGAEMALAEHGKEAAAAMMLAQYRSQAAHAKAELRLLGVEV